MTQRIAYQHVDVFTDRVLQGNGLAVVPCETFPDPSVMLDLAREFKQFETIFLEPVFGGRLRARIFTMEGELPFAGHPVLGAVAVLHAMHSDAVSWQVECLLAEKSVQVSSERTAYGYRVCMRQGAAEWLGPVPAEDIPWLAAAHNLAPEMLHPDLPVEVVSTGLPYVLIPVRGGLADARITVRDLEARIAAYGASYTYLFDPDTLEARTWDNLGLVEDSATGSAAGPVCAYLVRHGRAAQGKTIKIKQGRYANRPGTLYAVTRDGETYVSGDVVLFAEGTFTLR